MGERKETKNKGKKAMLPMDELIKWAIAATILAVVVIAIYLLFKKDSSAISYISKLLGRK